MKVCQIEGCEKWAKGRYCMMHYTRMRKTGTFELKPRYGEKRKHPLYHFWFDRKSDRSQEWDDFWKFVEDVGNKPGKDYFLVRTKRGEPFGPSNFAWMPHLTRQDGETNKAWWDRKRRARLERIPSMERKRDLFRRFGLTIKQYDEILASQKNVCALCHKPESAFDGRSGTVKNMAVDHCHATGKVRGILCWRCNAVLGKVEESTELLQAMIAYLEKHEG